MERLIQYVDEVEALIYAAPLLLERLRRVMLRVLCLASLLALQTLSVILALVQPPLALAVVSLLVVGLLFKAVMAPRSQAAATN